MTEEIVTEDEHSISICLGDASWIAPDGRHIMEKEFKVDGEVWRVYKYDPDPFPSSPHAHCVGGAKRFIGCKLHLGTAELFDAGNRPVGRSLDRKQFNRLIQLIRQKFPGVTLPIPKKV